MKDKIIDTLSIIPLAAVLGLDILFRNQFKGGIFLLITGSLLAIFGATVWLIGKTTLGKNFTILRCPKELVTNGIYSKIRHPMYYGGVVVYVGVALLFKSWLGLILTVFLVVPMLIYFMKIEEKLLREKYKEKYSAYKEKTIL
jgi:protein-S-isoprenylcysteine O-methyltransferase Ste14